jgi:hypothetical protein
MRRIFLSVIVVAGLCFIAARGWSAQGMHDESVNAEAAPAASVDITPSFFTSGVDHVANGVALRNRCTGVINLRGIAPGSTVKSAYLYWNYMDSSVVGAATDTELFNGKIVTATKVADQPDLCWGTAGDHTYRTTVTAYLPPTFGAGDYPFSALKCNDATGSNPWITGSKGPLIWEGASLVVTYSNSKTTGDSVAIFDKLSGAASGTGAPGSFSVSMVTPTPLTGTGLFTQIGADGQTGSSFSNIITNERDTFNAVILSGPGGLYPQSNWDGSNGWPQPQLWDTHTEDVTFSGGTTNTDVTTVGGDCIAAVAYVEQQGGF